MKIKANELRIGNWIKSQPISIPRLQIESNGWMQVTGYGISILESDTSDKLGWEGLEITEEILFKFGFEKRGDTGQYFIKNQTVSLNELDGLNFWIGDTNWGIRCKYVHEFQNVWFVHKGEELVLN